MAECIPSRRCQSATDCPEPAVVRVQRRPGAAAMDECERHAQAECLEAERFGYSLVMTGLLAQHAPQQR